MRPLLLLALLLAGCYGTEGDGAIDLPPAGPGGDCDRPVPPCPPGWGRVEREASAARGNATYCETAAEGGTFFGKRYFVASEVAESYSTQTFGMRCDASGVVTLMYGLENRMIACVYECDTCESLTYYDEDLLEQVPYPVCDDPAPEL